MDPYVTLGLSPYANQDELKRAFRKAAMKWHPDRAGESQEAKDKFQKISLAYKTLSRDFKSKDRKEEYRSASEQARDWHCNIKDDVFWDVMLEYAIGLVRSGLTKKEVQSKVSENGCDVGMAASIANQAFKFQTEFSENSTWESSKDQNSQEFKRKKFDYLSIQAFLGKQSPDSAARKTISDYHEIFNELFEKEEAGALFSIRKNRYLGKVFNRSILLFLFIAAMVYYLPVLTRHSPFGLIDYFQLPNVILSLMLVWSVYKKLWLLSSIGLSLFAASQVYYYYIMPFVLEKSFTTILLTSISFYLPFIFLTHLSNFFYYLKARYIIESVSLLYPRQEEKLIIIKNRGGTSRLYALLVIIVLSLYFLQMIPQNGTLNKKYNYLFSINTKTESKEIKQAKARITESERQFRIAEQHYYRNPPTYKFAKMAYTKSANYGSLLSAYKLGYMFLTGKGVNQDDTKAFRYFNQAIHSPLAAQPHSLSSATKWLSESYNSLGIMYLGGYGTQQNHQKARDMFRQALKYGTSNGMNKLMYRKTVEHRNLRTLVIPPEYN